MKVEIIKERNGNNVFVDGSLVFWVIGSKKNARAELKKHLENKKHN